MKVTIFLFLLIFIVSSCALNSGLERRHVEQYFVGSGVTRYFLPDLPAWSNYSQSAACYRKSPVRYFDMKKLRESFSINYKQSAAFQLLFNIEKEKELSLTSLDLLPLKVEERIFYYVSEKVQTGTFTIRMPSYKRVNLVWVDPFILDEKKISRLKKLMNSKAMSLGHPVFVSLCSSTKELDQFMQKHGFFNSNIKKITNEMLSLFDSELNRNPYTSLDVKSFFTKKQKIYFYSINKIIPIEIQGKFNVSTF